MVEELAVQAEGEGVEEEGVVVAAMVVAVVSLISIWWHNLF